MATNDGEEHRVDFEKAISLIAQAVELVGDYDFPGDDYVGEKLTICAAYLEDAIRDEAEAPDAEEEELPA